MPPTHPSRTTDEPRLDSSAELVRQIEVLVAKGYPALAQLDESTFRQRLGALAAVLPRQPFVVVVSRSMVPVERLVERTALRGRPGFTTMSDDDVRRFTPTPDVVVPEAPAYLLADVETGAESLGVAPKDALPPLLARGRSPLTLEEGLAVVTQHPEWLVERNCFEMLGSRAGDKRVTGMWVSKGAPRLGWCWAGNPHSWLGMASASHRVA